MGLGRGFTAVARRVPRLAGLVLLSCLLAEVGRRRATGPPAGLEKWHGTANRFCVFIRIRATSVLVSRRALFFVMVEGFVYTPAYPWCAAIIAVSAFSDGHAVILVRKHIPLFQSCTVVICGRWALLFIQAVKPALMKPCQTREPRGLLPSGGNSAANLLSLKRPARIARGSGFSPAQLRSVSASFHKVLPDPRAARPVAERR